MQCSNSGVGVPRPPLRGPVPILEVMSPASSECPPRWGVIGSSYSLHFSGFFRATILLYVHVHRSGLCIETGLVVDFGLGLGKGDLG